MYNFEENKKCEEVIKGIEKLSIEYKKILNSEEYILGSKIKNYKEMLKKGQFGKIFKKLLFNSNRHNKTLKTALETNNYSSYFVDKKIVVYTSIFGRYDSIIEPLFKPDNIEYVIITDQDIPNDSIWNKIELDESILKNKNNIEKNRFCKMFPERFFKEYDYSIYVDGNVFITSDLSPLIETLDIFPISMHRHKNRTCVYQEIEACIEKGKENRDALLRHRELLENNKVPENNGLLEATVIARKHNDELCKKIMNEWWNEFTLYSKRDQISLIDVLWKNNISIDKVATMGNNTFLNSLFIIIPHK